MAPESHPQACGGPPDGWEAQLSGTRFSQVRHVKSTGSTNAELYAQAGSAGAGDGMVLVADYQTAGRGRRGRSWEAPPGANLLFSVLLHPGWPPEDNPLVTSALAVATLDALADQGVGAAVKWPNDLVVENGPAPGKLAGILAEYTAGPHPVVVVGLGLNLCWPAGGDDGPAGASSLLACGYRVDRWDLLVGVLVGFEVWLTEMASTDGPGLLRQAHLSRSATVGRRVVAETPSRLVQGTATDIATDGSLLVQPDGEGAEPLAVTAADITHLRST